MIIDDLKRENLLCHVETLDHFGHHVSGILTHFTASPVSQGPWGINDYSLHAKEYRTGRQLYVSLMTDKIRTHSVHGGTKVTLTVIGKEAQ